MSEFVVRREDLDLFTVHDVSNAIAKLDKDSPDYLFRVQALVKRHVHYEKADLLRRLERYVADSPKYALENIIKPKRESHESMSKLPDEQIITWDVATHKYKPQAQGEK